MLCNEVASTHFLKAHPSSESVVGCRLVCQKWSCIGLECGMLTSLAVNMPPVSEKWIIKSCCREVDCKDIWNHTLIYKPDWIPVLAACVTYSHTQCTLAGLIEYSLLFPDEVSLTTLKALNSIHFCVYILKSLRQFVYL